MMRVIGLILLIIPLYIGILIGSILLGVGYLFKRTIISPMKKTDYTKYLPTGPGVSVSSSMMKFLLDINEFRKVNGKERLYWDPNMLFLARLRAQHWKNNNIQGNNLHNGLLGHIKAYKDELGYEVIAECATYGHNNVFYGLKNSKEGHRELMLGDYTDMGLCIDLTDPDNKYGCLMLSKNKL